MGKKKDKRKIRVRPNLRKIKKGKGRAYSVGSCKEKFPCKVPSCDAFLRTDNLRYHYRTKVVFKPDGTPIGENHAEFSALPLIKKQHITYFNKNGYTYDKLPPFENTPSNAVNPFTLSSTNKSMSQQSKQLSESDEDVEMGKESDINEESDSADSIIEPVNSDKDSLNSEKDLEDLDTINSEHDQPLNIVSDVDLVNKSTCTNDGNISNTPVENDTSFNVVSNVETNHTDLVNSIVAKIEEKCSGSHINEDSFAQMVADKVVAALSTKDPEELIDDEKECSWIFENDKNICQVCLLYSSHQDVPTNLKQYKKGNYGVINKEGIQLKKINARMQKHCTSALHLWCKKFSLEVENSKKIMDQENEQACTIQVTNALFCLKTSGSSKDFLRENDKDVINYETAHKKGVKPPGKNDGREQFFDIREKAFMVLSDDIKKSFHLIKSFSVTLDKVTTGHKAYTVIMTYYFWEGKINILLNRVQPMTSEDYDGVGTAEMVLTTLQDTLGLSKAAVASKCHHFVYDGVYATEEERLTGGGLKLIDHFARRLGLQAGDISGNWDMAHLLQLAYGDIIKSKTDTYLPRIVNDIFSLMSDFNAGKASLLFHEYAKELHYSVLTNKSNQTTRFVRSLLRGLQSLLRNLPCLYAIHGKDAQEAALENDNTTAKIALNTQAKISDGKFIAGIIGIVQILEEYALLSIDSQNLKFFPTSVLSSAEIHMNKIKQLGENWSWDSENPKLANIGVPKTHIENLLGGKYVAYVSKRSIVKSQVSSQIYGKFQSSVNQSINQLDNREPEEEDNWDLLSWEPLIPNYEFGSGSFSVENFSKEDLQDVEKKLAKVAKSIHNRYEIRFNRLKSPLLESAKKAFSPGLGEMTEDHIKTLLSNVIKAVPGYFRDSFDLEECLPGYVLFV